MVDWGLARQIARFAAGNAQIPDLGVDLDRMSADAEQQVADYSGLTLPGPPPPPEMIDRATWAEINLDTLSGFLDPVGERPYLADLLREYLDTVEVSIEKGAAGGLPSLPSAKEIVEAYREGGLAALVQTKEQRGIMRRLQAVMAVIEGYSEHVMDAVGERVLPGYEKLREAMDRRRASRSAPQRVLERLLGLDLKMRQYVLGKQFCDAVQKQHGIDTLNRVWEAPELLPNLRELENPEAWVSRI